MSTTERPSNRVGGQGSNEESVVEQEISPDDVFHLLQSQRRRAAIRYLSDTDGPVEMRDLAEQVAAWENDTTVQALTSEERQRAYIPLYQSHLPKLDEEGVINYNKNRGIVEKTPLATQLERYLSVGDVPEIDSDSNEHRWDTYYLCVSSLGSFLLIGAAFHLPLFTFIPSIAVVVCMLAAFWLVSVVHSLSV